MKSELVALVCAVFAVIPSIASADDDPGAAKHALVVAAMAKSPCIPPPSIRLSKQLGSSSYPAFIAADSGALVACVARDNNAINLTEKPFQCWTVDAATGALAARPVTFLPGRTYRVASGCAEGYCKPKEKPVKTEMTEVLAFSADGSKVARMNEETILVFDAKTKAFQREIPMLDKDGGGNGFGPHDAVYVGDMLVVVGLAAGPDGGAWLYNTAKGALVGPVGKGKAADVGYVNLFGGGYDLDDATHFVAADGYQEATVDLTAGTIAVRELPRPAACTEDDIQKQKQYEATEDGPKPGGKCSKALRAAQKKFFPAPPATRGMITVAGTGYKLVQLATKNQLLVFAAGAKKPKTVALATCKVK